MSMGAKIMNEIHIIRLRGGWRMLEPGPGKIVKLPLESLDELRDYVKVSMQRAFQRPVSDQAKLVVELCWQNAAGIKLMTLNPDLRIQNPSTEGRIRLSENECRYLLTIEYDPAGIEQKMPWGDFWLEVAESD